MKPGRKPPPTAARSAAAFLTHGFSPARAARWMNPALVRRHEHPLAGEQWAAQTSPETHARAIQRSTCPSPRPSPRSPIRPSANSAFPPTRGQAPAPPAPGALAHPAPPARPDVNAISTSYRPGSKRAADTANAAGQSQNAALCTTITAERRRSRAGPGCRGPGRTASSSADRRARRLPARPAAATLRPSAAVVNACRSVCGVTAVAIPARRAVVRTIRPAPCRSSRRPSPARNRAAGTVVDGPGGPRRRRDGCHLAARAGDRQGPVAALKARVLDVGAGGLRYPRPVQREQRDRRGPGWRPGPGGDEQRAGLAAVQRDHAGLVAGPRTADSRARSCRRRSALTGGSSATPPAPQFQERLSRVPSRLDSLSPLLCLVSQETRAAEGQAYCGVSV